MRAAFIVGVARSGTSILGEIVAKHPDVSYRFEPDAFWRRGKSDHHRDVGGGLTPTAVETARGIIKRVTWPKAMYVEKNPWHILRIPLVRAVVPEAKIVHIIRDGRDVACSMVPGGIDHLKSSNWHELVRAYDGPELYARVWQEAIAIALADLEGTDHLEVRYERLVAEPETEARRVMEYLGLDWHPDVAEHCRLVGDNTDNAYHAARQVEWYRPDHKRRVGRYLENLTPEQITGIEAAIGPTLQRLGYILETAHV